MTGVRLALFVTFLLAGGTGVWIVVTERNARLSAAAVMHVAAGLLVVAAEDLIVLLVAWELLTFSAYAVIRVSGRDAEGRRAAFWYLAAQISAAACFFVAIALHVARTGSLAVAALVPEAQPFMLAAVLVKTAMIPLHGWLVGAYTRVSPAAGVLLSVYATKVGVYTAAVLVAWAPGGVPVLGWIGAAVALVAVVLALLQHSARRLLSYHIVSQVGYMLAGVGVAGVAELAGAGITAGLFHAVNHIIYKALLFMVVAAVAADVGHDDLRRTGALWRRLPLAFVCGIVGAAAISGVPFTSGYASKELLKEAIGEGAGWLLTAAGIGTALSFTKFIYLLFLRTPPCDADGSVKARRSQSPVLQAGMVLFAVLSIAIGVAPRIVPGVPRHDFYGPQPLLAGSWPLAVALCVWAALRRPLVAWLGRAGDRAALRSLLVRVSRPLLLQARRASGGDQLVAVGVAVAAAALMVVGVVLFV